jgi:hypothetical protein
LYTVDKLLYDIFGVTMWSMGLNGTVYTVEFPVVALSVELASSRGLLYF